MIDELLKTIAFSSLNGRDLIMDQYLHIHAPYTNPHVKKSFFLEITSRQKQPAVHAPMCQSHLPRTKG